MSHSFVDLMADHDWSEADIKNRTEAVIASAFPPVEFSILQRKVQGQSFGYVLTPEEQAQLARYQEVSYQAGLMADQAREDMELLRATKQIEAVMRELATLEPEDPRRPELQAQLDAADPRTLMLVSLRNPPAPAEEPAP